MHMYLYTFICMHICMFICKFIFNCTYLLNTHGKHSASNFYWDPYVYAASAKRNTKRNMISDTICAYTNIRVRVDMHTYIYIRMNTHVYIHTCSATIEFGSNKIATNPAPTISNSPSIRKPACYMYMYLCMYIHIYVYM